jgi:hypothetical protein
MNLRSGGPERLLFLADVVVREGQQLSQTDARLFGNGFGQDQVASLSSNAELGRTPGLGAVCFRLG